MRPSIFAVVLTASGFYAACVGSDPLPAAIVGDAGGGGPFQPDASSPLDLDAGETRDGGVDGQGGSDGSDGGTPFTVQALSGLRLWLESTRNLTVASGGGTAVGTWRDSSAADGGGAHAAVQENVNPPTIIANGFGGRPTVSFTGGNGFLKIARHDDFQVGTGDFFLATVAKVSSGAGPLWKFSPMATAGTKQDFTPGQFCYAFGSGVTNGCTLPVYSPSTEPHVFMTRRKSSLFTFRVDGTTRGTLDVDPDPANIQISEFAQPSIFVGGGLTMQVSEIIVVVGPTPDIAVTNLETSLKAKYLIP